MVIDFTCGTCEAAITIDSQNEDAVWMMVYRYAAAHVDCGFVTAAGQADAPPTRLVLGPEDQADPDDVDGTVPASAETLDE